jgi:PAS domain S-box-containing protein
MSEYIARDFSTDQFIETDQQLSRLISNLPGFIYRCANDENWTMFYVSDVCERVTGYKAEDFINNRKIAFNDIIHPDYQKELHEDWEVILKKNKSFEHEYKIITASGDERWVWEQGFGVFDEKGKLMYLEGFIRDITERKTVQEALVVSERKFRALFNEMADQAVLCRINRNEKGEIINTSIIDLNESFVRVLGIRNPMDVIGKSPYDVLRLDSIPNYKEVIEAVSEGRNLSFVADFEPLEKRFKISAIAIQQDVFAIIATDITELMHYNDVLLEKNKELENYVYVTSHDLRSPLVNIQGFSTRLKKHTDKIGELISASEIDQITKENLDELIKQKIPHTLDYIFNSVGKMERMLNSLLQISRTGRVAMNIQQIKMYSLISKVIHAVEYQLQEINARVDIEDLPDCYGDEAMLNQLFSNIITNAIKYRDDQRQLKISISGVSRYKKVLYRIMDNGIGIPKEHLEKIWYVFYRVDNRHVQGDGIGLSVVKRIVEKHNGRIWVESTERYGTTFFIELPAFNFSEN